MRGCFYRVWLALQYAKLSHIFGLACALVHVALHFVTYHTQPAATAAPRIYNYYLVARNAGYGRWVVTAS
jgi:hypothetical protein